ncbi:MAG: CcmD family protein [Deltaproteobacteria bacterium]|nr:CcmD family protein [Deltaproteobacteria bacterium]
MIQGGWEYVVAAYTITWVVLGGYALSLWVRHRRLLKKE